MKDCATVLIPICMYLGHDKYQVIYVCVNNAFILEKRTIRLNHIMVDLLRCTVDSNKNSEQFFQRQS